MRAKSNNKLLSITFSFIFPFIGLFSCEPRNDEKIRLSANIGRLQAMIEIYNVDLKQYPENTETLKSEAQKNGYWEELKKTYNTKEEAELIDLLEPPKRNDTEFPVEVEKGNIVYIPFFAEEKVTGYVIYGAEENNRIFKRDGKIFYLTNN